MPAQIRLLEKAEIEEANYIWSQAFRRGRRGDSDWVDNTHGGTFTCGVWDQNGLQAVVVVCDYRVHLGAEVVAPMGGIGGVACLPASRGKGYAGDALRYALQQMRERGFYLSALFPFSWDYYRRFGWEWVGVRREYRVPTGILQVAPETASVRAYRSEDRPALIATYTAFAQRYRGAFLRTEVAWDQILNSTEKEHTFTYVYEQDGRIEGYFTYRGGEEKETGLREWVALTPRAYRGLLGLLRRHEMQVEHFKWKVPADDPFWAFGYHWDIETSIQPATQGRVVDVPRALEAWRPAPGVCGRAVIRVRDDAAPWNTGTWQISCEERNVQVRPATEEPQVTLDIQALSQAYYGTPDLDAVRHAGRLTVHDETGYCLLRDLLRGPIMWINDSF